MLGQSLRQPQFRPERSVRRRDGSAFSAAAGGFRRYAEQKTHGPDIDDQRRSPITEKRHRHTRHRQQAEHHGDIADGLPHDHENNADGQNAAPSIIGFQRDSNPVAGQRANQQQYDDRTDKPGLLRPSLILK